MDISIVIPVYQAAAFIGNSIVTLSEFMQKTKFRYELIFVNDGSTDNTAEIIEGTLNNSNIKFFSLKLNQGKFASICTGMRHATGKCCIFMDADLPYDLNFIVYAHQLINTEAISLVVGDRTLARSISEIKTPYNRKFSSYILSTIIRLLVTGGLSDTQCGCKAFSQSVAKELFTLLKSKRFPGDIELLYISLKYNLTIKKIPVRLVGSSPSTVNPITECLDFLYCILSLKLNWIKGRYKSEKLSEIGNYIYW